MLCGYGNRLAANGAIVEACFAGVGKRPSTSSGLTGLWNGLGLGHYSG